MRWFGDRWPWRTVRSSVGLLFFSAFAMLLHSPASAARTTHVKPHRAHVEATRSHHARSVTRVGRRHVLRRQRRALAHAPGPPRRDDRPLIVIDAGHGGNDPGAIGLSGTMEKTITLTTANELRRVLESTGRYRVAMTRTGDRTVSLSQRLAFAHRHDADLLIAIHADASGDHRARGASVYVSNSDVATHFVAKPRNSSRIARALAAPEPRPEPSSAWLQYSMIEQLADDVRMVAAPARHAQLYVLGSRTIPSVLLEMGFLSNRQDEALLRKPAHRHVLVEAVKDAIDDYFAAIRQSPSRT